MKTNTKDQMNMVKTFGLIGLAGVACLGAAAWIGYTVWSHRKLDLAEKQLQRGFGMLAADTIDSHRHSFISKKGCPILIGAYHQARQVDRLEWTAQACLNAGIQTPEIVLGLAAVREMTGRDQEALQVLGNGLSKFDKSPDLYYAIAKIFRRNKQDKEAIVAYQKAIERSQQDPSLSLEAMAYFTSIQHWDEAKVIATNLRTAKTDNPEVKLLIARTLIHGNTDPALVKPLVDEAQELISKKPEMKEPLQHAYSDVLNWNSRKPANNKED